ncbi:methyltransferase [Brevibacterium permense]|uniref:Class I SAM-dependent methyltransferase n=1 Tax=Brevibacterium permense TaxID=234834 RepID=A0ABN1ZPK0_9MICO|nr:class I SAM-dependent methyltransferase [Brevibacterium permense]
MTTIRWTEDGIGRAAHWHSENGAPPPATVQIIGDETTADEACRSARAGVGLLWRGDFHNGRQLVQAMSRRLRGDRGGNREATGGRRSGGRRGGRGRSRDRRGRDRFVGSVDSAGPAHDPALSFFAERDAIEQRARLLGRVVVELGPDFDLALRRAPDVAAACRAAYGPADGPVCVSLTELGGVLSAYEWQLRGVEIPALGDSVHPRYGVFSPVRGEYLDLVAQTPLPWGRNVGSVSTDTDSAEPTGTAFDLGTGTGVLAAILLRRGAATVVATDINPRAVACASENLDRLCPGADVSVIEADLFPPGRADLIVCNPPWLPAQPTSALEIGIYDPGSAVLHRFIERLTDHLTPAGEGWLIISDLAERLGLRPSGELRERIETAGLRVLERIDTVPRHPRAADTADALHAARSAEVTSLWRLGLR